MARDFDWHTLMMDCKPVLNCRTPLPSLVGSSFWTRSNAYWHTEEAVMIRHLISTLSVIGLSSICFAHTLCLWGQEREGGTICPMSGYPLHSWRRSFDSNLCCSFREHKKQWKRGPKKGDLLSSQQLQRWIGSQVTKSTSKKKKEPRERIDIRICQWDLNDNIL